MSEDDVLFLENLEEYQRLPEKSLFFRKAKINKRNVQEIKNIVKNLNNKKLDDEIDNHLRVKALRSLEDMYYIKFKLKREKIGKSYGIIRVIEWIETET